MKRPRWPSSIRLDAGAGTELRLLRPADARALLAVHRRNRATYLRWTTAWMHRTRSLPRARAILRLCQRERRAGKSFLLGIWEGDALAGQVALSVTDAFDRSGELGYSLDAAHQGRGLATRACRAVMAYAFGMLRLHRLEARIHPANRRSLALARRLGFRRVGLQRERQRMPRGWGDAVIFDLLAREWRR